MELELLIRIEETRQKMQFAQEQGLWDIELSILGALMQDYETLYRLRRDELIEKLERVKAGAA